ncbi:MAG: hypothetical protein QOG76_515, partial [Pseudonocardiales bacterium]|nr:hypothetical protein [Pseudonocardiales bacterium]
AGAAGTALLITVLKLASSGAAGGTDVVGARAALLCAALIATVTLPVTFLVGRRGP